MTRPIAPSRLRIAALLALAALTSGAACQTAPPATQPATQPAPPVSDAAAAVLDRIEAKARETKTLQAKLRYDRNQGLLGDKQRRFGTLVYVGGPPAKFAARFDKVLIDNRLEQQDRWYIFDGTWLVEKLADQTPRQFFKRQIVAPGTPPEQADALALGGGPFAVPVNLRKDVVVRRFTVELVPPAPSDPKDTVHLKLVPRPGQRTDFTLIELWYDASEFWPVRGRAVDERSESESIIELSQHKRNDPVDAAAIDTAEPKERGWNVHVTPWEGR